MKTYNYPTIKVTPAIQEQLLTKLRETKHFFVAVFVKKTNGAIREMNCKFGVRKHVTGKGLKYKPLDYGLLTVWDPSKIDPEKNDKGYRSLNLNSLMLIHYAGKTYQF